MFKNCSKAISMVLILAMVSNTSVSAATNTSDAETGKAIEAVTGTNNLVSGIDLSDEITVDGENIMINIPEKATDEIVVTPAYNEEDTVKMTLPKVLENNNSTVTDNGTVVYGEENESSQLAVQAIKDENFEGVRSLIKINNNNAKKEYSFNFDLDADCRLVTSAEYLGKEFDTGEVYVVNSQNIITSVIQPAWAVDADGNDVKTYYKVDGETLTQVVEFDNNSKFPIVADPSWWKITKCVASVGLVVAGTFFAGTKLLKAKKYIKQLGGILETAKLLIGATSAAEKGMAALKAFAGLCGVILDIDSIKENCFS